MKLWYFRTSLQASYGPHTAAEIADMIAKGTIDPRKPVWRLLGALGDLLFVAAATAATLA